MTSVDDFTDDGSLDFFDFNTFDLVTNSDEFQKRSTVKPIRLRSLEELEEISKNPDDPNFNNAKVELELRDRFDKQTFIQNMTDTDFLRRKANRIARQPIAGVLRTPGGLAGMGAMFAAVPEFGLAVAGVKPKKDSTTAKLLQLSGELIEKANTLAGVDLPRDTIETIAEVTGPSLIRIAPGAKVNGLLANAVELATPFTIGGGKGRIAANIGIQTVGAEVLIPLYADEPNAYKGLFGLFFGGDAEAAPITGEPVAGETHSLTNKPLIRNPDGSFSTERSITVEKDGKFSNISTIIDGIPVGEKEATDAFIAGVNPALTGQHDDLNEAVNAAASRSKKLGESLDPVVADNSETDAGLRVSDLAKLSSLGVISVGFGLAPSVIRRITAGRVRVPKTRRVSELDPHAPTTLKTVETAKDLLTTTQVSPRIATTRILQKSGVSPRIIREIEDTLETETYAVGRSKSHNTISTGKIASKSGTYDISVPVRRIVETYRSLTPAKQGLARQYVILHDILDDMGISNFSVVAGIGKRQARQKIAQIKRRFPEIEQIHQQYKVATREALKFMSEGQYSMFTRKKFNELVISRSNFAPFALEKVNPTQRLAQRIAQSSAVQDELTQNIVEKLATLHKRNITKRKLPRSDPFELLATYTDSAIQAKMRNVARGQIVDALLRANRNRAGDDQLTIVRVTKKVADKNKLRAVKIWRNGKIEHYVASQHMADLLRFDPHYTKHTSWHLGSRLFQAGTTGYLAPWFAPVSAIRELLFARVTTPTGRKKPGVFSTPKAVAQQLGPKAQLQLSESIYRSLDSGPGGMLRSALQANESQMRGVADRLASSYVTSIKHISDTIGGYNAALTQTAVRRSQTRLDEIFRNVKIPYSIRVLASGWMALLDAVHNAPRFAFISRNFEPNMSAKDLRKLIRESRNLTGDITDIGQVFTTGGRRIGLDEAKPSVVKRTATDIGGTTIDFLRASAPFVNPMIQGMRKIGSSYLANPWRFQARLWTTTMLPVISSYLWTAATGGEEAIKYMMEERDERSKSLNLYVHIPGSKPEDGTEIPLPYELAAPAYMALTLVDHVFRADKRFDTSESLKVMATNILENFLDVTTPPLAGAIAGTRGIDIGDTLVLGQTYIPRTKEHSNFNHNFEMALRAIGGSAADVFLHGANAFMDSGSPAKAIQELGFQVKKRTPLIKSKQLSLFNASSQKLFRSKDQIRRFIEIYRHHIDPESAGTIGKRPGLKPSKNTSAFGRSLIEDTQGIGPTNEDIPKSLIGLNLTLPPTNLDYLEFAKELKRSLGTNQEGFRSLSRRFSALTKQIKSLRPIQFGNLQTWAKRMSELRESDPQAAELVDVILEDAGLTISDREAPRVLINELEKARFEVTQRILELFRDVEERATEKLGKPIRFEDLEPYGR